MIYTVLRNLRMLIIVIEVCGSQVTGRWYLIVLGINYYLSCYYRRQELGIRAAIFFSAAAFSGAFGGLLYAS